MNTYLEDLTQVLGERLGVGRQDLLDVLHLLRAHRNLAAIVLCCRRLCELFDTMPTLAAEPAFPDLDRRLSLIRRIAALEDIDGHYLSVSIEHNRALETPLRPHTGDSGLCDLLLIRPKNGATAAQQRAFEGLLAWFAWQMFQHQARVQQPEDYLNYLDGPLESLVTGTASRVYGAFLALRMLADPIHVDLAIRTAVQLRGLTERDSIELARRLRAALEASGKSKGGKKRASKANAHEDQRTQAEKDADRVSLALSLFLEAIWLPRTVVNRDREVVRKVIARQVRRVEVARYGDVSVIGQALDTDAVQSGFAIEIVEHAPIRAEEGESDEEEDEKDPGDGEGVEPSVVLFLGEGDPIASWYAAKSALHHIERANALLPWPEWRLSTVAIEAIVACITPQPGDDHIQLRARLTVGLSLLTGRSLEEVSALAIGSSQATGDGHNLTVAIIRPDFLLEVRAGRPKLKEVKSLPQFCAPWVTTLRLPLPEAWGPLIAALPDKIYRRNPAVLKAARALISALPSELAITPRGIAGALKLALLKEGRDDLALIKVLTDANDANLNNLIHYASYERAQVELLWRQIVTPWVGRLAEPPPPDQAGERVGSPQGIEVGKVAARIAVLKRRYHVAAQERRWPAMYNLMAIYLSNWIGLDSAGRRKRQSVPGVITADGWALPRDKGRPDGSTDRYVPFGPGLLEQLAIFRSLCAALSIVAPEFALPPPGAEHLVNLRIFENDNHSVPYQPLFMDRSISLRDLPGNWGRKLVRSSSDELAGRFKDAGLGHWVRGRHPWTLTSTFPAAEFRKQWLEMQARLERELGFEVLRLPELPMVRPPPAPLPAVRKNKASPAPPPPMDDAAVHSLLERGRKELYEATFEWDPPSPEAALGLARDAVRELATKRSPHLAAQAERICEYIRIRTKVPLSAIQPRARFQQNWLVDGDELANLVYLQEHLLPAIERDLTQLPTPGVGDKALQVDTGRLVVAAALRAGLLCVQHLDAFLEYLGSTKPVHAVGEVRLIELKVRAVRSGDLMRRTVLLEPYLAALITVERERVRRFLASQFKLRSGKRHARWNEAFRAYLKSLGVPADMTLAAFLSGMRQHVQLTGAPVLAAYASGEVLTEDLPIAEFRRLAGLAPAVEPNPEDDFKWVDEEDAIPNDIRKSDYARKIGALRSPLIGEWKRVLRNELSRKPPAQPLTPAQTLLCLFASHMIERYVPEEGRPGRIGSRARRLIARNLQVVWHGLMGFSDAQAQWTHIDESALQSLWDLTAPHFPARTHHGAWARFREFLVEDAEAMDRYGFSSSVTSGSAARIVSAKILSGAEIRRIELRLRSVRSGIGTAENRQSAARHFEMTADSAARRAETEKLRWSDLDDDMIRFRPYEGRTLKTACSERAVPVAMLRDAVKKDLEQARTTGVGKPIDAVPGRDASGDNFFDRVAKAMKAATGDDDIGPHHLRHTKPSMLFLFMLANVIDLKRLSTELPWVGEHDLTEQCTALLGSAGQCGQGLKAISALLGHLHETTTLRHYIHTLCVALYAYQTGRPEIPLHVAFEKRISSRTALYRDFKGYVMAGGDSALISRKLRDRLEALAQQRIDNATAAVDAQPLVYRNEAPLVIRTILTIDPKWESAAQSQFESFEEMHRYLMNGQGTPPADIEAIREEMKAIAAIGSGKRGSDLRRHPMPQRAADGTPLPEMVLAGACAQNALSLLAWLQRMHSERPSDYEWLLGKWLHASERLEGSMRLDGDSDMDRARALEVDPGIKLEIRAVAVSKRRAPPQGADQVPARYRLRIRFLDDSVRAAQDEAAFAGRGANAVRWVLTWLAARGGGCNSTAVACQENGM